MKIYLDRSKEDLPRLASRRYRIYAYGIDLIFARLLGLILSSTVVLVANHIFHISGEFNDFDLELMNHIPFHSLSHDVLMVTLIAFGARIIGAILCWMSEFIIGASPAKHILKIQILSTDGLPASSGQLLLRWILKNAIFFVLCIFLYMQIQIDLETLFYFVGVFLLINGVLLFTPVRQTLHDLIAGTAVFYDRNPSEGPDRIERVDPGRRDPSDLLRPRW